MAYERAAALQECDPEASAQLIAQARHAERRLRASSDRIVPVSSQTYDPMKLYAQMAKYYGWSHKEMDWMHFPTFFGYVREANLMIEKEKAEIARAKNASSQQQQVLTPEQARSYFSLPESYTGDITHVG